MSPDEADVAVAAAPPGEWLSPAEWQARARASRASLLTPPEAGAWREALAALQLRDNTGHFWNFDGESWRRFEGNTWVAYQPPEWLSPQLTALAVAPPLPPVLPDPEPPYAGPEVDPGLMAAAVEASQLIAAADATAIATEECPACGGELPAGLFDCPLCEHPLRPHEPSVEPATVQQSPEAPLPDVELLPSPAPQPTVEPTVPASMQCAQCGGRNPLGARFCRSCGQAMAPAAAIGSTCASCAGPLVPGARFCARCGTPTGGGS